MIAVITTIKMTREQIKKNIDNAGTSKNTNDIIFYKLNGRTTALPLPFFSNPPM